MSDKVEFSRLLVKRTDSAGIVPTIPTGSTLSTFIDTDTFIGEFFLNTEDDRLFVRTDNGQFEIMMSGNTSGNTQNLGQTLVFGNETLGNDIIMSQDDRITSFTGETYIEFNKVNDPLIKLFSSGNTGYSDIVVRNQDLGIVHSNSGTTYGELLIDNNSFDLKYTDGVDTTVIQLTQTDITLDTLAVIIENLPTSSSGLTSNQLFTQTSTQLGGSGIIKVICIV